MEIKIADIAARMLGKEKEAPVTKASVEATAPDGDEELEIAFREYSEATDPKAKMRALKAFMQLAKDQ